MIVCEHGLHKVRVWNFWRTRNWGILWLPPTHLPRNCLFFFSIFFSLNVLDICNVISSSPFRCFTHYFVFKYYKLLHDDCQYHIWPMHHLHGSYFSSLNNKNLSFEFSFLLLAGHQQLFFEKCVRIFNKIRPHHFTEVSALLLRLSSHNW